jgi:hypothetical protein
MNRRALRLFARARRRFLVITIIGVLIAGLAVHFADGLVESVFAAAGATIAIAGAIVMQLDRCRLLAKKESNASHK